ncbi:MAG TPA: hypothetical protein VFV80_06345 [Geminicoccaceae bacterium]|nr:hypothetical protein [Geminicoccaceae bacterium]
MGPYYDHQVGRFERPDAGSDRDALLARARRARAEATAGMLGAIWAGLRSAVRICAERLRHAGAGAALMPPRPDVRAHRAPRLTGCCD